MDCRKSIQILETKKKQQKFQYDRNVAEQQNMYNIIIIIFFFSFSFDVSIKRTRAYSRRRLLG